MEEEKKGAPRSNREMIWWKRKRRIFLWLLVIGWMTVIFCFSAQNASESAELSGGITEKTIMLFVRDYEELSAQQQISIMYQASYVVRKLAHFTEYFILGVLLCCLVRDYSLKGRWTGMLSWGIGTLYAASDEFHQMFSDGRSPQIADVCIDSAGVLAGTLSVLLLLFLYHRLLDKRRKKGLS